MTKVTQMIKDKNYYESILPQFDCKFSMSVRNKYFNLIKSGQKDIELRAFDEKRRQMKAGDKFLLYDAENTDNYIICKILNLHVAPDFETLFEKIDIKRTGFTTIQDLEDVVFKFITKEDFAKNSVVGIEIEVEK